MSSVRHPLASELIHPSIRPRSRDLLTWQYEKPQWPQDLARFRSRLNFFEHCRQVSDDLRGGAPDSSGRADISAQRGDDRSGETCERCFDGESTSGRLRTAR